MTSALHSYTAKLADKLNTAYEEIGTAGSSADENQLYEDFADMVVEHWPEILAVLRNGGPSLRNEVIEECAKVCDVIAAGPSNLWEEAGCWKHAAENCAVAIRDLRHSATPGSSS